MSADQQQQMYYNPAAAAAAAAAAGHPPTSPFFIPQTGRKHPMTHFSHLQLLVVHLDFQPAMRAQSIYTQRMGQPQVESLLARELLDMADAFSISVKEWAILCRPSIMFKVRRIFLNHNLFLRTTRERWSATRSLPPSQSCLIVDL